MVSKPKTVTERAEQAEARVAQLEADLQTSAEIGQHTKQRFDLLVVELNSVIDRISEVGRGNVMYRAEAVREIKAALMAAGVRRS